MSLLNKLCASSAQFSEYLSAQVPFEPPSDQVPECPSAKVLWVPKCSSAPRVAECASALWVSEHFKCLRAQEPKCPWSARVSKCLWSALWVTNFPFRALRVKKLCNIARNGLLNSFKEFWKTFSEYILYISLLFFFLGKKICKFYYILLARCNYSKWFQKRSLTIL